MPISFGGAYGGGYDPAAAARERAAIDIANTRALMQARQQTYKNLGDDIGDAAKLYSTVQLKRADQELQDTRERDARRERRQLHEDSLLQNTLQSTQSGFQKILDDHEAARKSGMVLSPKQAGEFRAKTEQFQDAARNKHNLLPQQQLQLLNKAYADLLPFRPSERAPLPTIPKGFVAVEKPGGGMEIVSDPNLQRDMLTQQHLRDKALTLEQDAVSPSKSKSERDVARRQLAAINQLLGVQETSAPVATQPPDIFGEGFNPTQPITPDEDAALAAALSAQTQQQPPPLPPVGTSRLNPNPETGEFIQEGGVYGPSGKYDTDGNPEYEWKREAPETKKAREDTGLREKAFKEAKDEIDTEQKSDLEFIRAKTVKMSPTQADALFAAHQQRFSPENRRRRIAELTAENYQQFTGKPLEVGGGEPNARQSVPPPSTAIPTTAAQPESAKSSSEPERLRKASERLVALTTKYPQLNDVPKYSSLQEAISAGVLDMVSGPADRRALLESLNDITRMGRVIDVKTPAEAKQYPGALVRTPDGRLIRVE